MTQAYGLTVGPTWAEWHDAHSGTLIGRVDAGYRVMSARHFQRLPLDAGALERAIEWTEDAIERARLKLSAASGVSLRGDHLPWLMQAAGLSGDAALLHVDAVEQLFSRLVLQAFGQLPPQQRLPDSPDVFATVVLLREVMHHLGVSSFVIRSNVEAVAA